MSLNHINNNQTVKNGLIENINKRASCYYNEHPNSVIPFLERELRQAGFEFEISNQVFSFMPKNKKVILPIAIKYYHLAKEQKQFNEQNHILGFFHFKGLEEVIPMLLEDYYSEETPDLTRWFISDCLYQIRSKRYVKEYLDIVSNKAFGTNRKMVVLLLGKLKEESSIPILVDLLEDEEVSLHAIDALSEFKREDFRCYFERFENSTHPGWRKYAKKAINKLKKD